MQDTVSFKCPLLLCELSYNNRTDLRHIVASDDAGTLAALYSVTPRCQETASVFLQYMSRSCVVLCCVVQPGKNTFKKTTQNESYLHVWQREACVCNGKLRKIPAFVAYVKIV